MPVNFLSKEQERKYGRFTEEPSDLQLARYFHLDDTDRVMINRKRGDHNRLGFAIQLCTVRFLGTFLANPIDIPSIITGYIGKQLNISDISCLPRYMKRSKTHEEHANDIKQYYGYKDFADEPEYFQLGKRDLGGFYQLSNYYHF